MSQGNASTLAISSHRHICLYQARIINNGRFLAEGKARLHKHHRLHVRGWRLWPDGEMRSARLSRRRGPSRRPPDPGAFGHCRPAARATRPPLGIIGPGRCGRSPCVQSAVNRDRPRLAASSSPTCRHCRGMSGSIWRRPPEVRCRGGWPGPDANRVASGEPALKCT